MKKILFGLISIIFAGQVSFAQPVSDMAVIPMGITVQSIMRLNVTKGGNIEFVFSRISDIATGITWSTAYQTHLSISASQNWALDLGTDAASFSDGTNAIDLDVVEYRIVLGNVPLGTTSTVLTATDLTTSDIDILHNATGNLGDGLSTIIEWQCGADGTNTVAGIPAGRYTVNVYLSLVAD